MLSSDSVIGDIVGINVCVCMCVYVCIYVCLKYVCVFFKEYIYILREYKDRQAQFFVVRSVRCCA